MINRVRSKRVLFTLAETDIKLLNVLVDKLGENRTQVLKRALITLSHSLSNEYNKKNEVNKNEGS